MFNFTKAYSERGADMGRPTFMPEAPSQPLKLHLERVSIDSGGYDRGGAYWGLGDPLYVAHAENVQVFYRTKSRAEAKAVVKLDIPSATFYR